MNNQSIKRTLVSLIAQNEHFYRLDKSSEDNKITPKEFEILKTLHDGSKKIDISK